MSTEIPKQLEVWSPGLFRLALDISDLNLLYCSAISYEKVVEIANNHHGFLILRTFSNENLTVEGHAYVDHGHFTLKEWHVKVEDEGNLIEDRTNTSKYVIWKISGPGLEPIWFALPISSGQFLPKTHAFNLPEVYFASLASDPSPLTYTYSNGVVNRSFFTSTNSWDRSVSHGYLIEWCPLIIGNHLFYQIMKEAQLDGSTSGSFQELLEILEKPLKLEPLPSPYYLSGNYNVIRLGPPPRALTTSTRKEQPKEITFNDLNPQARAVKSKDLTGMSQNPTTTNDEVTRVPIGLRLRNSAPQKKKPDLRPPSSIYTRSSVRTPGVPSFNGTPDPAVKRSDLRPRWR